MFFKFLDHFLLYPDSSKCAEFLRELHVSERIAFSLESYFFELDELQLRRFLRHCFDIFSQANWFNKEERYLRNLQNYEY